MDGRAAGRRLIRHDRLVAWNAARAMVTTWLDRATVAIVLIAGIAALRIGVAALDPAMATWAALVVGAAGGITTQRLVATRLAFHARHGLLAADALHPAGRRGYVLTAHALGFVIAALATLIVGPALPTVSLPGFLAGALLAGLAARLTPPGRLVRVARPGWTLRRWSHHPVAGVGAAAVLLAAMLPSYALNPSARLAAVGIGTLLLGLALTGVDAAVVRFMTLAGHRSRRILAYHAKGLAAFLALAAPAAWIGHGPGAAGMVAAAGAVVLLLLAVRVLAYRIHAPRFADLLVAVLAGLLLFVATAIPVALPPVVVAFLWRLRHRGRAREWLLA